VGGCLVTTLQGERHKPPGLNCRVERTAVPHHLVGHGLESPWFGEQESVFDELGTLCAAAWRGSWLDAIRDPLILPGTPKPPLPFVIAHIFLALGDRVFLLRLPSALFATATVPLVELDTIHYCPSPLLHVLGWIVTQHSAYRKSYPENRNGCRHDSEQEFNRAPMTPKARSILANSPLKLIFPPSWMESQAAIQPSMLPRVTERPRGPPFSYGCVFSARTANRISPHNALVLRLCWRWPMMAQVNPYYGKRGQNMGRKIIETVSRSSVSSAPTRA
jgi:hypothetical protein